MKVAVVGAGVGGLAAAVRLADLGHQVTVFEQAAVPGGKCGRLELGGYRFDTGPSLLTMPWVVRDLVGDELELMRVEPVTRYEFADGTSLELSADLAATNEALESWSPGAGADWMRFLGVCAGMWRASQPFLTGPPPWPPRRPRRGDPAPDPRDLLRVKPWHTLRTLARGLVRDPRLRMVIERFATYAGADPRRAPAALAVAGYVEHAFGAWHVRGGLYAIVEALVRRLEVLGGELRVGTTVHGVVSGGIELDGERHAADTVVWNGDSAQLPAIGTGAERSLSGYALMLGARGRPPGRRHHTIVFPADYDAEFEDVFVTRRPVREPTLYLSSSCVTDDAEAPSGGENLFVLVNAPTHGAGLDWDEEAGDYESALLEQLAARGHDVRDRIEVRGRRTPADLARQTGALAGAIYGSAPHGRLGTLRRPGNRVGRGPWLVGGTVHPGGGLPLVMLSAQIVAREIGPA